MAAPVLASPGYGFPTQFASKIENLWTNQQGDNAYVTTTTGDTLIAVAFGLRSFDPFDLLHGTAPYGGSSNFAFGQLAGLNDFNAVPTISDKSGTKVATITAFAITSNVVTFTAANQFQAGDEVLIAGLSVGTYLNAQTLTVLSTGLSGTAFEADFTHANVSTTSDSGTATKTTSGNDWSLLASYQIADSDYTPVSVPPPGGDPYPSSQWSLDGYYPSIFIWVATNVAAGTYAVNLNSMFAPGHATAPVSQEYGQGSVPIFDGGVNFQVIRFTGMTAVTADGNAAGVSTANPPALTPFVTTGTGDLVLVAGIQKSSNSLSLGTDVTLTSGYSQVSNGKSVGSEAHYIVEWGIQTAAGSYTPQFGTDPRFAFAGNYETLMAAIALSHS